MGKVLRLIYRAISTHLLHKAGLQLNGGANLTDVTNIIAFLGSQKAPGRTLYVRNFVYSKTR